MRFTTSITAAILAFTATGVLAAPLPQLAGEGAACNSVLSQTDNGVGYGVENAEDNIASTVSSTSGGAKLRVRQLAGEGAACDSVLTQTNNGIGHGIENAEENTAKTISSVTKTGKAKRQLDKIANGAGAIGDAAGLHTATDPVVQVADNLDGSLTSGAADAGASIANTEDQTLENAGSQVPRL